MTRYTDEEIENLKEKTLSQIKPLLKKILCNDELFEKVIPLYNQLINEIAFNERDCYLDRKTLKILKNKKLIEFDDDDYISWPIPEGERWDYPDFVEYLKNYEEYLTKKSNPIDRKFICNVCNYKWISRKKFGTPAKCPKCNSTLIRKKK